jgi:pimeloyl-ACP methyl ester carboxylesterase
MSQVVITVHGANTIGDWQMKAHPVFSGIHDFFYHPYHYGHFWLYKAASTTDRRAALERFYRHYRDVRRQHDNIVPSMIAHSFGTYLVSEALDQYPLFEIDRLILCGSIIRRDFDWRFRSVRYVRHDIAERDWVAKTFRGMSWAIPGTGSSGSDGFTGSCRSLEERRFAKYGHSTVINSEDHCRRHWLPFLRDTETFKRRCDEISQAWNNSQLMATFARDYFPFLERVWFSTRRSGDELMEAALTLLREFAEEGSRGRYHEQEAALWVVQKFCAKVPPRTGRQR